MRAFLDDLREVLEAVSVLDVESSFLVLAELNDVFSRC